MHAGLAGKSHGFLRACLFIRVRKVLNVSVRNVRLVNKPNKQSARRGGMHSSSRAFIVRNAVDHKYELVQPQRRKNRFQNLQLQTDLQTKYAETCVAKHAESPSETCQIYLEVQSQPPSTRHCQPTCHCYGGFEGSCLNEDRHSQKSRLRVTAPERRTATFQLQETASGPKLVTRALEE